MSNDRYGLSRVVGEKGVLPQRARKLDPALPCREAELLIDVESLNIDAASFKQIKDEVGAEPSRIAARVQEIVRERGKMQNPVTGSGGMLIGRVKEIGAQHPARGVLQPGDRIATLVSLSLTPLVIDEVKAVHPSIDRVDIRGHALLFATGLYAKLPTDMPDTLALAALDVCGAPALVARYVRPGMTVAVLGAGKSGALCLAQARKDLKGQGRLLAMDISEQALATLKGLGLCDVSLKVDATQAVDVMEAVAKATDGALCDLVINCASVGNTEMASILSVKDGGTVIFFSMATSFTAAALGAEGVGKDVTMLVGNGYVPGHADLTLELLRSEPALRRLFETRYV
ncbi:L-erythro-3,5-diaminohexanoate dehydrogenase [Vitiosangium sp. GDMCC 1.1324]|uniref:L-erythro-3,5-diaminohexanoate dehydrogenase n=1 Tax=Vitiosangium sp. (strain GDMCC 1.1324) TaxID=2138576 RepID=UPI000D3B6FCD|nr:L-erythro-3,5-diaminohexanoate dehydrogenase [Vitiosangium sp. GDMCC 1.1324]PTL77189.1 L-erythro-3,5-diaminohexanoate dehydrogenase [Vitiosangium sp. GDMCC 1.1324]